LYNCGEEALKTIEDPTKEIIDKVEIINEMFMDIETEAGKLLICLFNFKFSSLQCRVTFANIL